MSGSSTKSGTSLKNHYHHHNNSVILDNVDDYLAPSQACINPLFQPLPSSSVSDNQPKEKSTANDDKDNDIEEKFKDGAAMIVPRRRRRRIIPTTKSNDTGDNKREEYQSSSSFPNSTSNTSTITLGEEKTRKDTPSTKEAAIIKASMADCLACSGCVTTAETVLMEQQHSLSTLRDRLSSLSSSSSSSHSSNSIVITISPNSWADLCRHWKLQDHRDDHRDDHRHVSSHNDNHYYYYSRFTSLLSYILSAPVVVVDGNVSLLWTWMEEAHEFCQSYRRKQSLDIDGNQCKDTTSSHLLYPSVAMDSKRTQVYHPDGTIQIVDLETVDEPKLPLISASCPALVCLVEKTLTHLLPHLSQTVSPMSMVGWVLKEGNNKSNKNMVATHWEHWAIMPCHDKKLEASRKDFFLGDRKEQCVDLVISTRECVELVEEWVASQIKRSANSKVNMASYLKSLPASAVSSTAWQPQDLAETAAGTVRSDNNPLLIVPPSLLQGSTINDPIRQKQMLFASGGHANFIFQYAAKELFDCHLLPGQVEWKPASLRTKKVKSARLSQRNNFHYYEAKLYRQPDGSYSCYYQETHEGKEESLPVFHFAIAHGMQTMQRALKLIQNDDDDNNNNNNSSNNIHLNVHYLEAMACPYGCVNGGGSVRSTASTSTTAPKTTTTIKNTIIVRETPTETQTRVQETLEQLDIPIMPDSPGNWPDEKSTTTIRTRYHVVPPMQYTMGATAGVQVENIQW
jgi:iron only hydrogenase large subunit-like protein